MGFNSGLKGLNCFVKEQTLFNLCRNKTEIGGHVARMGERELHTGFFFFGGGEDLLCFYVS
jgi:hypothetical protein